MSPPASSPTCSSPGIGILSVPSTHTTSAVVNSAPQSNGFQCETGSNEAISQANPLGVSSRRTFTFGAESKGKVLRPIGPNTSAVSLCREVSQVAPNLRQTFGHHASGTTSMSAEPPGTVNYGRVVASGQTNRVTEMSARQSVMAETSEPSNPNSLVATDPKVITATVASGLIATRENQDEHYSLSGAPSSSLGATSEPCQAQISSISIVPSPS